MGYTHYWHRLEVIPEDLWERIRSDFEKLILPMSDLGVGLAGGLGNGPPEITDRIICFNGIQDCGHPDNEELSIKSAPIYLFR